MAEELVNEMAADYAAYNPEDQSPGGPSSAPNVLTMPAKLARGFGGTARQVPAGPYPDDNPKTAFGVSKPPMHHVPPVALLELGKVMEGGAKKYGLMNWRHDSISASTYYDAAMRHLMAWWDGQDIDPESGRPHLAHVMACCALVLDGQALALCKDDRPPRGTTPGFIMKENAK